MDLRVVAAPPNSKPSATKTASIMNSNIDTRVTAAAARTVPIIQRNAGNPNINSPIIIAFKNCLPIAKSQMLRKMKMKRRLIFARFCSIFPDSLIKDCNLAIFLLNLHDLL